MNRVGNEMAPQQFPKMEMSQQYMPGAPKMQKDYDPLSGLNSSEQPGGNGNGSNSNDEGGDKPGGVSSYNPSSSAVDDYSSADIAPAAPAPPAGFAPSSQMQNDVAVPVIKSKASKPELPVGDLSTFLEDTTLLRTFLKFLKKKTDDYKLLEFYLMAGQFKSCAEKQCQADYRDLFPSGFQKVYGEDRGNDPTRSNVAIFDCGKDGGFRSHII